MIKKIINSQSGQALSTLLILICLILTSNAARGTEAVSVNEEQINQAAEYCAEKKYNRGSRLYREILEQYESQLSVGRYLEIIQSLVDCNDVNNAIDFLEAYTSANPKYTGAKLLLARQLAWNGRLLQADEVADQILAIDPSHRQARLIKADAASWRGDFYTALPIYEQLLAEEENFDARLGYTYALLATGSYEKAKFSSWWLYAAEASDRHTIIEVNQALLDQARQNVSWKTEYLNDKTESKRLDHILSFNLPFERANMTLSLRQQKAEDPWTATPQELKGLMLAGLWRMNNAVRFLSEVAWVKVGTDQQQENDELNLLLAATLQMRRWFWQLELSRELYDDSASILANHIIRRDIYSFAQYKVNDWIRLDGELRGTDYSDDNESYELVLRARYALKLISPRIELGYKYFQQGFQRQSGGGYFAPDQTDSNQITLGFSNYSKRFQGSGEVFYGRQTTSIASLDQAENIAGLTLDLSYYLMNSLRVNASVEGGHFALGKENGYYYYLASLGLSVFF